MAYRILILGASYGSLFGTKCLMAGQDVTLVCRAPTAALINARGTEVRIKLKGEDAPRAIQSAALPGRLDAKTPEDADPAGYDLVVLAMQEPQYLHHTIRLLLTRIAAARVPCLSLMNMPPLPYLKRIAAIDAEATRIDGHPLLKVKINGGSPPFTYLLNGAPAHAPSSRREAGLRPEGLGFAQISVIDATGATDRVTVRLQ
jgi:membrane carboxypeptidase/penicillin-binding protein PbpC